MKYKLKYKNWNDVTIKDYYKIKNILLDEDSDIVDRQIELVAYICDIPFNEAEDMPISDFNKIIKDTQWMNQEPKGVLKSVYLEKYKLDTDIRHLSVSQYTDYENYLKMGGDNVHLLCSCFLIPKDKKYGDDPNVVEDLLNNLPIVDASTIAAFFLLEYKTLEKVIRNCLVKRMKKQMKKEKNKIKKIKIARMIVGMKQADSLLNGE